MTKGKAVLFDLDGTLLNTLEDLWRSTNLALEECGFQTRTEEEVRNFVGNGAGLLIRRCLPGGEENPRFGECLKLFRKRYGEHMYDHTRPYEGVEDMLDSLAKRGVRIAVVSNKPDFAVKELCRQMFPSTVSLAIGESEGVRRKPAPDTVEAAARGLGVRLDECVYVGDSEVDVETAANAGIRCISVSWGFRSREALKKAGAVQIADHCGELLAYLEEAVG
ncbi:MAG: HAD family hydrolase [Eubacteriales bacterium]|nr:HAD family hydrolase [Eubacteriales bacterium]